MVDLVRDSNEMARRFRAYAFSGNAPAEIADRMQTMPGVAADVVCDGAELLYAWRDKLDEDGLRLLGEMFQHADKSVWTAFNQDGRSARIVALVSRDLGEKSAGRAKAGDEWPAPMTSMRDGVDWRTPPEEPAAA